MYVNNRKLYTYYFRVRYYLGGILLFIMKNTVIVLFISCCFVSITEKTFALSPIYVNNTYTNTTTEGRALGIDVFRTIQEAVNAVDEGGIIYVSTGIYNESITIKKSLSLIGSGPLSAVGSYPNAAVINGGNAVGTILIDGSTSTINVAIRNLIITHGGYGIAVLHNSKVSITRNTINNYLKNGVTFGPVLLPEAGGISGVIRNNSLTGLGQTDTVPQNGIQVSENNTAIISGNTISNNMYTVPGKKWATGILIHKSKGIVISNNTLTDNQIGINLIQADENTIIGNTITGNTLSKAGIMVSNPDSSNDTTYTTTSNIIKRNTLTGGLIGIWSNYSHGNKYLNNIISSSLRDGIYLWNSNSNILTNNAISSIHSSSNNASGVELDDEGKDGSTEEQKGSQHNILVNNVVVKSDSGFLLAKNSKNNNFSNNRFNGSIISPAERDTSKK